MVMFWIVGLIVLAILVAALIGGAGVLGGTDGIKRRRF